MSSDGGDGSAEETAWAAAVAGARALVTILRSGGPPHERHRLVEALKEAAAAIASDQEFVAALGTANGHGVQNPNPKP
jgi:hypothetical protein